MKETKGTIEQSLSMYKETVSPSRASLINILNQIPEKELIRKDRRAIRSPYIWLGITQVVMMCSLFIVVFPTLQQNIAYWNDPFYLVDKQVQTFESNLNTEDDSDLMMDYNNL